MVKTKIAIMSDSHSRHFEFNPGKGDIFIHSGDAELIDMNDVVHFAKWMGEQDFTNKYFVPGNHDTYIENELELSEEIFKDNGVELLINKSIIYKNGELELKFYGMPQTPQYGHWAFMHNTAEMAEFCKYIPMDTDILISHGPPHLILDFNGANIACGCFSLFNKVIQVKPIFHCFGHIHESSGFKSFKDIMFINAAIAGSYNKAWQNIKIVELEDKKISDFYILED